MLDNTILVYGQMNESPGARFRAGHAALTMTEYFREDRPRTPSSPWPVMS